MLPRAALVVGEMTPVSQELLRALRGEGYAALPYGVADVIERATRTSHADVMFVSAALTRAEVEGLRAAVDAHRSRPVRAIVFAEPGDAALGEHVGDGLDYVVAPFQGAVLRRRLVVCDDAEQMIDDAAHLATYERELQIAAEIQEGFLPDRLPEPEGWRVGVRFQPARQVAGDFYDAYELINGRRMCFLVADVCDKGVGAALFMALIRSLLRNTASHAGSTSIVGLDAEWDPEHTADHDHRASATAAGVGPLLNAVTSTDAYMVQNHLTQGYFATVFFGVLNPATGSVIYINGGHNPPFVRRRDGRIERLRPTGPALGMMSGSHFLLGHVHLELGDLMYLYTDGVTEAKDEHGTFFGEERLQSIVDDEREDPSRVLDDIEAELEGHMGAAEQFDDITMMVLHRLPDPVYALTPLTRVPAPGSES